MTQKELEKVLNFLLQHGALTFDEYNNLLMRGLPYIKK